MDTVAKNTTDKLKTLEAVQSVAQEQRIQLDHQRLVQKIMEANREPKRRRG